MTQTQVVQEDVMGCAVACVASILGVSYKRALRLFGTSKCSTRGYYCPEICKALRKGGLSYGWQKLSLHNKHLINIKSSIIFVARSKLYRAGHYLVRLEQGYMNPWLNFPKVNPAKAGIVKRLPGKPAYVVFPHAMCKC